MTRITITALLILLTTPAAAADLTGRVTVVDGDTLSIAGQSVRLWGISAPELREPLGKRARDALADILAQGPLFCVSVGGESHGRMVARCSVNNKDVGDTMVASGWARDCPRYSKGRYAVAELGSTWRGWIDLPAYCRSRK